VRFSTLESLCEVLNCQPGDLLVHEPDDEDDQASRELDSSVSDITNR